LWQRLKTVENEKHLKNFAGPGLLPEGVGLFGGESRDLGSISSMFYAQLLRGQIPKA